MSLFHVTETPLTGLFVLQRKPIGDKRGYFERMYCGDAFFPFLGEKMIKQINHTDTALKGTVRGMHFQYPPHAEIKIVSCLHGEVFDVAVDLRKDSPTFLKSYTRVLSANNHTTMIIPEGFAHGFQSLCDDCEMLYLHTAAYAKQAEAGLNPMDKALDIKWPLDISVISDRDRGHALIDSEFKGIEL